MNDHLEVDMSELSATEDFLSHYQLQHDPFMERTPGFKFFTPQRKPVLAQLHHMAHFSEQLQAVVGPQGAGKTLLRQALVASSNKDSVQCIVTSGREQSAAAALGRFLCQALNVADLNAFAGQVEQLHNTGMQLYVVVDDAELLTNEALQLLADLSQSAGRSAPRVFLFGEETLADGLAAVVMPVESVWLHLIELAPLSLEETRDYLSQRLEGAGQGIELLDDGQVQHIWEQSAGWPGEINLVARQQMLAAVERPHSSSRRATRPVLPVRSLVALLLVGGGVFIAWMMGGSEPEPARTVISLPDQVTTVDVTAAPVVGQQIQMPVLGADRLERIAEEQDGEQGNDELLLSTRELGQPQLTERVDSQHALPDPVSLPEPLPVVMPEPVRAPVSAVAPPQPEPAPVSVAPVTAQEPKPVPVKPAPKPVTQPVVTSSPAGAYHQSDWYRQRAAGEYALQLLGTRSRQAAVDFVGAHKAVSDLGYFETLHEGQPWFVVTQGRYANRAQAQQGAAQLPEALRKLKPWPRSMASIKQSLR